MDISRRSVFGDVVLAVWSFAEATFFFVVPDVWLSWLASRRETRLVDCGRFLTLATTAAIGGGLLTRGVSSVAPETTQAMLSRIPAISEQMVEGVYGRVENRGFAAVTTASSRGEPYKLYAAAAGVSDESILAFVGWSVLGRLPRFLVAFAVALLVGRFVRSQNAANWVWGLSWLAIYASYWSRFSLWS